jgi:hypothetical protein
MEMPRVQDPPDQALEPHDSYERFFLREYRGVVELASPTCGGSSAGATGPRSRSPSPC